MTRKTTIVLILVFLTAISSWGQSSIPKVVMNYVSVDPATNDVKINWVKSNDVDVKGYIIFRQAEGASYYLTIDTVMAATTVTYWNRATPVTSTSSNAGLHSETYNVIAYDSLTGEESQHSKDHQTIFLTSAFRPCYAQIKLSWTPYTAWFNGVANYTVYYQIDTGPWTIFQVVNADVTNLSISNLEPDRDYNFYVEAFSGGIFKSTSNLAHEYTDMPRPPAIANFNANYASVVKENYIELSFTIDTMADVNRYELLRSDSLDGDFDVITEFTPGPSQTEILYTDYAPTGIIHYYKLQAINTCDIPFAQTTNYASNIVLTATAGNSMRNKIVWNNYYKWRKGIHHFDVFRIVDYMEPTLIAQIPYGDTIHIDRLDQFLYDPQLTILNPFLNVESPKNYLEQPIVSGLVCYFVKAIEKPGQEDDYTSTSNKVCVSQMPRVFVPNAFTPNSDLVNDLFFPYISLAGLRNYEMRIYNRWGNLVFRTLHIHQGWNGTMYDGSTPAPIGTYIYQFSFTDGDGESHEHTGQVTIVR